MNKVQIIRNNLCNLYISGHTKTYKKMIIQWYLLIRTHFDSTTSQSEHICRTNFDLQSDRSLTIRPQKHVAADAPSCQSAGLACTSPPWTPLSLERLSSHSGPQLPWLLRPSNLITSYLPPQSMRLQLWPLANLITNENIFNTLNNRWWMNC